VKLSTAQAARVLRELNLDTSDTRALWRTLYPSASIGPIALAEHVNELILAGDPTLEGIVAKLVLKGLK
jgi:hypothetical protein